MPMKFNTKKTPFCMSSNMIIIKYGIQYNYWVGHSVMKTVDDVAFKKRNSMIEVNDESSEKFEMEVLSEVALDKALMVIENSINTK